MSLFATCSSALMVEREGARLAMRAPRSTTSPALRTARAVSTPSAGAVKAARRWSSSRRWRSRKAASARPVRARRNSPAASLRRRPIRLSAFLRAASVLATSICWVSSWLEPSARAMLAAWRSRCASWRASLTAVCRRPTSCWALRTSSSLTSLRARKARCEARRSWARARSCASCSASSDLACAWPSNSAARPARTVRPRSWMEPIKAILRRRACCSP
ncbi:hypothetical protein D3C86_1147210 [compost metagenome]